MHVSKLARSAQAGPERLQGFLLSKPPPQPAQTHLLLRRRCGRWSRSLPTHDTLIMLVMCGHANPDDIAPGDSVRPPV
jgi:hypothetical protein